MVRPPPPGKLNWSKAMRKAIIRLLVALNPYIMALAPYTGGMRSYNWPLLVNQFFDWFKPAPVVKPAPVAIYVGDTFDCLPPAFGFVVDTELPAPIPEPMPEPAPLPMPAPIPEPMPEPAPLPMPAPVSKWRFTWKDEPCEPVGDDLNNLTKPQLIALAEQRGMKVGKSWKKDRLIQVILANLDDDVRLAG